MSSPQTDDLTPAHGRAPSATDGAHGTAHPAWEAPGGSNRARLQPPVFYEGVFFMLMDDGTAMMYPEARREP